MLKQIRYYSLFQFFFGLLLWVPIFYEYQKHVGLSATEIFSIQSYYYIIFCLCEIPTGIFADRFGFHRSIQAGAVLLTFANLLPIFFYSYSGFMLHFACIALARSLTSGAASAWLYEYLKEHGESHRYKDVEGRARSWGLYGRVVGWAAIGWLMDWKLSMPYLLTFVLSSFSAFYALRLIPVKNLGMGKVPLIGPLQFLFDTPRFLLLMFLGVGFFVLVRIIQVNLYQPILSAKEFPVSAFGWTMSLLSVAEAIGSGAGRHLRKLIPDLEGACFFTLMVCACIFFLPLLGKVGTVAVLAIFSAAFGFGFPLVGQIMNDAITDSRFRATLLSLESIVDRSTCALVAYFSGAYVAVGRLNDFLILSALATGSGVIILYFLLRYVVGVPRDSKQAAFGR